MPAGTNARAIRRALVDKLVARGVVFPVSYSAPVDARQLADATGKHDAAWTEYRSASYEPNVFGGGVLILDETCQVDVVVQSMRFDGTEQSTVDERAEEMLRDVLAVVATDPTVSIVDTGEVKTFEVVPIRTEVDSGVIGDNPAHRATRFVVTFEALTRLELT